MDEVRLRCSPSYADVEGGSGRFEGSWESRERCRLRGARVGFSGVAPGGRRELVDALWEGGPTKRAGAGRRFEGTWESLLDDMVEVSILLGQLSSRICGGRYTAMTV